MSDKTKAAKPAKQDKAPAEKKVVVQVKVTKGGLRICGSTAARGAVVNCYQDTAEFHEKRGEVEILGTR